MSAASNDGARWSRPDAATWRLWILMSWLLPALWCWLAFGAGWMYVGYIFAVVLYPLVGVAGMIPRIILRRLGASGTPWPVVPFLVVQWWALFTPVFITMAQFFLGPVFVGLFGVEQIAMSIRWSILSISIMVVILAWIAGVVIASSDRGSTHRDVVWKRISLGAAIAAPVVVVVVLLGALFATGQQRDGAGATVVDALRPSVQEQAERLEARYTELNEKVSEVRRLIAEDGWEEYLTGVGHDSSCAGTGMPCYMFEADFSHATAGDTVGLADLAARLEAEGWVTDEGRDEGALVATADEGVVVEIFWSDRDAEIGVRAESVNWWGDEDLLIEELGGYRERTSDDPET